MKKKLSAILVGLVLGLGITAPVTARAVDASIVSVTPDPAQWLSDITVTISATDYSPHSVNVECSNGWRSHPEPAAPTVTFFLPTITDQPAATCTISLWKQHVTRHGWHQQRVDRETIQVLPFP